MKKVLFLLYGVTCYSVFLGATLYAIGFAGNLFAGRSMDSTPQMPLLSAALINASLLLLCLILHQLLTGTTVRKWIARYLPQPLERSTYILTASCCLLLLMLRWQPMGGVVWQVEHTVLKMILCIAYVGGWSIVFTSTFLINHFELFGMRQVWLLYQGKSYTPLPFRMPVFYKLVRHPLYVGFMIASWATPTMTVAHLLLALFTTLYILVSVQFGDRDLLAGVSEQYRRYVRWVPLLMPFLKQLTERY
ncbi:methanethiol S-methyltransferase [Paraflavitalea pollutisoli]|uniref:methanethiol S-methyltransferase n=1 Tax=Paraflavitalea pollutisoli TaxID=3034143 RepID=UPI0023EDD4CB|nr:methanethiol S-methyltransferase [Paraflavitalea sp. H1-2-19X]